MADFTIASPSGRTPRRLAKVSPRSSIILFLSASSTLIVAANTTEADEIAKSLRRILKKKLSGLRPILKLEELVRVAHYKVDEAVEEIEKFREQDEGILVAVNMADIRFDDENLEVLAIARPVRMPIAYVQIRGRVLRRPRNTSDNIKASKYAILIDLTGAAKHEKSVKEVELGEHAVEDFNELEGDLVGKGKVDIVHGNVKLKGYEIRIVPEKLPQPYKPQIPFEILQEEILILKILRLLKRYLAMKLRKHVGF